VRVVAQVGDRRDVGGDQVLVLPSGHRRAVVGQLVLHVTLEIVEAAVVQDGQVGAVPGLEISGQRGLLLSGDAGSVAGAPGAASERRVP